VKPGIEFWGWRSLLLQLMAFHPGLKPGMQMTLIQRLLLLLLLADGRNNPGDRLAHNKQEAVCDRPEGHIPPRHLFFQ
jgi:hypothetical protein